MATGPEIWTWTGSSQKTTRTAASFQVLPVLRQSVTQSVEPSRSAGSEKIFFVASVLHEALASASACHCPA